MLIVRVLAGAISAVLAVLAVVILFGLTGTPHTPIGWVWGVLIFAIAITIAWISLTLGLNMSRSYDKGAADANQKRGDQLEATGRTAGAVVGKGLGKVARIGSGRTSSSGNDSPPRPAPAPDTKADAPKDPVPEAAPKVTIDDAARSIGSMVGRRIAERKPRDGNR
jgi:hypothetical protein